MGHKAKYECNRCLKTFQKNHPETIIKNPLPCKMTLENTVMNSDALKICLMVNTYTADWNLVK